MDVPPALVPVLLSLCQVAARCRGDHWLGDGGQAGVALYRLGRALVVRHSLTAMKGVRTVPAGRKGLAYCYLKVEKTSPACRAVCCNISF